MAKPLRFGGVPEHFNIPWTRAISKEDPNKVTWSNYKGGTGDLCRALATEELDVGLLLTEGAIKYSLENPQAFKLCGVYVDSPLAWGIHVGGSSKIRADLQGETPETVRFAVSRMGSGSHLMAAVLAQSLGWDPSKLRYHIVGTIDGAQKELALHQDLVFLWEKGMTQPLVERGVFRRVGVVPTPWPCFVVCVTPRALKERKAEILRMLRSVERECREFAGREAESLEAIVGKFSLKRDAAEEWFRAVRFAKDTTAVKPCVLAADQARAGLQSVGLLEAKWTRASVEDSVVSLTGETSRL